MAVDPLPPDVTILYCRRWADTNQKLVEKETQHNAAQGGELSFAQRDQGFQFCTTRYLDSRSNYTRGKPNLPHDPSEGSSLCLQG